MRYLSLREQEFLRGLADGPIGCGADYPPAVSLTELGYIELTPARYGGLIASLTDQGKAEIDGQRLTIMA